MGPIVLKTECFLPILEVIAAQKPNKRNRSLPLNWSPLKISDPFFKMTANSLLTADDPFEARVEHQPYHGKRILLVEDEPLICQFCVKALRNSGYVVDAAGDGTTAWIALQLYDYDLLITDNDLPTLSGVDLLKRLHAACFVLPVIMATGNYPQEEFNRHLHLPPATVLLKPYTVAKLLTVVNGALGATRNVQERWLIPDLQRLTDRGRQSSNPPFAE